MEILNEVLRENAAQDDGLKAQAVAFAAPGGTIFSNAAASHSGTSGSVQQGGSGGGGVGGWVHLSDVCVQDLLLYVYSPISNYSRI